MQHLELLHIFWIVKLHLYCLFLYKKCSQDIYHLISLHNYENCCVKQAMYGTIDDTLKLLQNGNVDESGRILDIEFITHICFTYLSDKHGVAFCVMREQNCLNDWIHYKYHSCSGLYLSFVIAITPCQLLGMNQLLRCGL